MGRLRYNGVGMNGNGIEMSDQEEQWAENCVAYGEEQELYATWLMRFVKRSRFAISKDAVCEAASWMVIRS